MVALSRDFADPDFWGYLAFGRLFWHSNKFPYQDVFSYAPTLNPWIHHEWLTGVLFYPLYMTLGAPGLQILKYALGLATAALVYLTARRRGAHPLVAAIVVWIVFSLITSMAYSPVRAQVFTYFFFAFYLYLLEETRLTGNWRGLALLPLLQLAWCNLHGGFLAGLGLIGIYLVGELLARRPFLPYLVILIISILVTLINPYGIYIWGYPLHVANRSYPYHIEWASIFKYYQSGEARIGLPIFLVTLALVMLISMRQSRWREVTASLALAVTLPLGLAKIRHLPFFLILVGAYLPICFRRNVEFVQSLPWLRKLWNLGSVKRAFLISLFLLTLGNLFIFVKHKPFTLVTPGTRISQKLPIDVHPYPVDAVRFIKKQGLSGNILTQLGWGCFVIWELYPQCLVAFDGRYDMVYPIEVEQKFYDFYYARPQWRRFLEDYPPDFILLNKNIEVAKVLQKDPSWRQEYSDSTSVLFVPVTRKQNLSLKKYPLQQINRKIK